MIVDTKVELERSRAFALFAATGCANVADEPRALVCAPLKISGKITVINGYEDLLEQWTYGKALVAGYKVMQGANAATLVTYSGTHRHGVMIQRPEWNALRMQAAIQGATLS
ncbi:MAG TPA: hypothetical protein VHR97_10300 [Candidatus Baltobacteraceae bacterium]|jgi:hypothetical protein|nr:hypothetical protein [Candidatus Baltobacteraceae bacterium]